MKRLMPFILLILLGCSQGRDKNSMNQVTENIKLNKKDIKKLASKKIYFGHMSVGYNIIDGLKAILPADSGLNIVETSNPEDFSKPVFAHSQNGQNKKPETKIWKFESLIKNYLGNKVNIAFFKFCYIDITANTNIEELFELYQKSFKSLTTSYPNVKFIHITVPLTTEEQSFKGNLKFKIKNLLGKKNSPEYDNIQRTRFNDKLTAAYGKQVFDLARLESTNSDNTLITSTRGGITHYKLLPEYTNDGGHLNKIGAKYIASQLILFIINLE